MHVCVPQSEAKKLAWTPDTFGEHAATVRGILQTERNKIILRYAKDWLGAPIYNRHPEANWQSKPC